MITLQLCNPALQEPYRNFQDGTTTYVCFPAKSACQLHLQMTGSGEVKIEADGDELFQTPLDEDTRIIPLTEILRLTPPPHPLAPPSLMQSIRARLSDRTRATTAFSAVVTQDVPASVATVHFQLLSPEAYEEAFRQHLAKMRGSTTAPAAASWQAPQIQLTCWNCQTPTPGTHCTSCGADQDEE